MTLHSYPIQNPVMRVVPFWGSVTLRGTPIWPIIVLNTDGYFLRSIATTYGGFYDLNSHNTTDLCKVVIRVPLAHQCIIVGGFKEFVNVPSAGAYPMNPISLTKGGDLPCTDDSLHSTSRNYFEGRSCFFSLSIIEIFCGIFFPLHWRDRLWRTFGFVSRELAVTPSLRK